MRQPIYIGNNRMVTFLPDGTPVVVDPRSLDSLDLILSWGVEQDVMPIVKKLLTRKSVFVDVGANFGVYSAVAISHVLPWGGKVFSIEANPSVFKYLEGTIYANHAYHSPNIKFINAAAAETSGLDVVLNVDPERLGGSTLRPSSTALQYTVKTVSLDEWLPADVAPDIIKIDVEGYEPYVMQGCKEVIARSPDVVFILEMFPSMLAHYGFDKFLADIREEYGLSLYVVGAGSTLRLLVPDERPEGDNYVFATKRSLEGIAEATYCVHHADLAFPAEGPIFHGPYIPFKAGKYKVVFHGAVKEEVLVRFQSDWGHTVYGEQTLTRSKNECHIVIPEDAQNFEIAAWGAKDAISVKRIDFIREA